MLDIHAGVRRDELKPFKRILEKQFPEHVTLSTMEDRWEDWAAHWPEGYTAKDDIIHVIITTDIPLAATSFIVHMMQVFLNELTDEDNPFVGRIILTTDHGEWNQFYVEMSVPE